jgi:hypothetical protein
VLADIISEDRVCKLGRINEGQLHVNPSAVNKVSDAMASFFAFDCREKCVGAREDIEKYDP